jgi:hypothetical protein
MTSNEYFLRTMATEIDNLKCRVTLAKERVARAAAELTRSDKYVVSNANALAGAARELAEAAAQLEQTKWIVKHLEDANAFVNG